MAGLAVATYCPRCGTGRRALTWEETWVAYAEAVLADDTVRAGDLLEEMMFVNDVHVLVTLQCGHTVWRYQLGDSELFLPDWAVKGRR